MTQFFKNWSGAKNWGLIPAPIVSYHINHSLSIKTDTKEISIFAESHRNESHSKTTLLKPSHLLNESEFFIILAKKKNVRWHEKLANKIQLHVGKVTVLAANLSRELEFRWLYNTVEEEHILIYFYNTIRVYYTNLVVLVFLFLSIVVYLSVPP